MLHRLSVGELSKALSSKEVSSVELTRHYLDRMQKSTLNAYITITAERALAQAERADDLRSKGTGGHHPLCGVPVAHKDLFCTEGVRTSCGSKILDNFIPPYSAAVVEKTHSAQMPMLGKANCDEFAMGSSNENSFYGAVKNPWNTERVPGGSSGGSAAIVASGLAPFASGTDTGGSIRQPAAFCGITGLKPTYGAVSRYGMVAYASSFDQGGVLAHTAEDCAWLYDVISGYDERDSTSVQRDGAHTVRALNQNVQKKRVGVCRFLMEKITDPGLKIALNAALQTLEKMGMEMVDIDLPEIELSLPAYYVLASAEASSNLSRYDGVRYGHRCNDPKNIRDLFERSRAEGFGVEVKRRIMVGTYALSSGYYDAFYLQAQKLRRLIAQAFQSALKGVDCIYCPVTPNPAFAIGALNNDPAKMYLQDIFTIPANLAGLPAVAFPAGFSDQLPVGAQLIGNYFDEALLLAIVHQFQQQSDWHNQHPRLF